jgi:uncharacterized protein
MPPGLLTAGGLYLGEGWLRLAESDAATRCSYLVGRDAGGVPDACCPTYRWEGASTPLTRYHESHHALVAGLAAADADPAAYYPTLLVGPPGARSNELVAPGPGTPAGRELLRALLADAGDLAELAGARSLTLIYLTTAAALAVRDVAPATRLAHIGVAAQVEIAWDSFAAYLASLNANRRGAARNEIARFERYGCRVTSGRLSGWYRKAAPLMAALQRRYGHGDDESTMLGYLRRIVEALDDRSLVLVATVGDDLVGLALCFEWGRVLYGHMLGFDYAHSPRCAAYYNLAYYLPIRHAIEHGYRRLELGTGSLEAKLMRGASFESRWSASSWPDAPTRRLDAALAYWNQLQLMNLAELGRRHHVAMTADDQCLFRDLLGRAYDVTAGGRRG